MILLSMVDVRFEGFGRFNRVRSTERGGSKISDQHDPPLPHEFKDLVFDFPRGTTVVREGLYERQHRRAQGR